MSTFDIITDKESTINPAVLQEEVYLLDCHYCGTKICDRGLKSFLIADEKVELFSTDTVDRSLVELTDEKFRTDRGNVVGYHVAMPCRSCLESQNNGHFWMFNRQAICPYQRLNIEGTSTMVWGDLTQCKDDSMCDMWGECER
ncbi:FA72B-like protein [Mya arenaria]|uniref:FA72B-like protein n=1 Tax=Mya arenaria TaxID=6604 RepID=A0ABY7FZ18_MYAAR|nr:FA72B-like protein [Mya arenaria]